MRRVKQLVAHGGEHYGYAFRCPGCDDTHVIPTKPHPRGWDFSGTEERPTFAPSILVHEVLKADGTVFSPRCHSYVRNGHIEYLSDCGHPLAGKTILLPEIS